MSFEAGDTWQPREPNSHLWIVVTDPQNDPSHVVSVNLTTYKDDGKRLIDDACVLERGDHPFIKHRSCVLYEKAIVHPVSQLEQAYKKNLITCHSPLSPAVLRRVREGFLKSEYAKPRHQRLVEPYLPPPESSP